METRRPFRSVAEKIEHQRSVKSSRKFRFTQLLLAYLGLLSFPASSISLSPLASEVSEIVLDFGWIDLRSFLCSLDPSSISHPLPSQLLSSGPPASHHLDWTLVELTASRSKEGRDSAVRIGKGLFLVVMDEVFLVLCLSLLHDRLMSPIFPLAVFGVSSDNENPPFGTQRCLSSSSHLSETSGPSKTDPFLPLALLHLLPSLPKR